MDSPIFRPQSSHRPDAPRNALLRSPSSRQMEQTSAALMEDKMRRSLSDSMAQRGRDYPVMGESSSKMLHHLGSLHEFFQPKQGYYSEPRTAEVSEMMKSNSLDNAPIKILFCVINGILDGSIERKNGELPYRVACLLRQVAQEIERKILLQAANLRYKNNLVKAREEKYLSRIRVLEALAAGTSEETQIVMDKLLLTKMERTKIEEREKLVEQDVYRLTEEKNNSDCTISELKKDLEKTKKSYGQHCQQLETEAKESRIDLEERIKEFELLLAESRKKMEELEVFLDSKSQSWKSREKIFLNFISLQLKSMQDLRADLKSIKHEALNNQSRWCEEFAIFGQQLEPLSDVANNYHTILAENRKLYNEVQELKGSIRVYCRVRPFLHGENRKLSTIEYLGENGELLLTNSSKQRKDAHRSFKFNKVFGPAATQGEIFLDIQPLIRSVLDGYDVCIFAYGQTGSGKTYTMSGPSILSEENWGVNYRALNDLFEISISRGNTFVYEIGVQMVEIYNEQVRDLLANDGLPKRLGILSTSQPNGLAVPDASMVPVKSTSDVLELMQIGLGNRAVGATALNDRSSRSHSVLTLHVRGEDVRTGAILHGSLHLVDLAGSERLDRSEVTGDRLKEAQHINRSLSALGDVIFALSQKSAYVPYRNSKLTQVLQSSLGGQAKTLMFVQINPDVESYSETLSTLKFAERVSGVELGAARSNGEGKDIKELMDQVVSLKDIIATKDEKIKQLQQLKDVRTQSKSARHARNSLRHYSSSRGIQSLGRAARQAQRLSGEKILKLTKRAGSDPESYSDFSDEHSEASSRHSQDDLKQLNKNREQTELTGADTGTETDSSTSSLVESNVFHNHGNPSETRKERRFKIPLRIPRPFPKNIGKTTSTEAKVKKHPSSKSNSTGQVKASSCKTTKRWH